MGESCWCVDDGWTGLALALGLVAYQQVYQAQGDPGDPFQGLDGGMVSHRAHTMIVPINVSCMFVDLDASNIVGRDVGRDLVIDSDQRPSHGDGRNHKVGRAWAWACVSHVLVSQTRISTHDTFLWR